MNSTRKLPEFIITSSKVTGYKISISKSIAFLHTKRAQTCISYDASCPMPRFHRTGRNCRPLGMGGLINIITQL